MEITQEEEASGRDRPVKAIKDACLGCRPAGDNRVCLSTRDDSTARAFGAKAPTAERCRMTDGDDFPGSTGYRYYSEMWGMDE
jgi:hypothetical protein